MYFVMGKPKNYLKFSHIASSNTYGQQRLPFYMKSDLNYLMVYLISQYRMQMTVPIFRNCHRTTNLHKNHLPWSLKLCVNNWKNEGISGIDKNHTVTAP